MCWHARAVKPLLAVESLINTMEKFTAPATSPMDTTWMPFMWPIKTCLLVGIIFLLIQGISELLKSYWASKKGEWPGENK